MLRNKLKVAGGVVAGMVFSGGLALAAIPGADGTITGCYTKRPGLLTPQGSVRVVDSASQCRTDEVALTWNQKGQPGTPGAPGAPGAAGLQGPAGPVGPAGAAAPSPFASAPTDVIGAQASLDAGMDRGCLNCADATLFVVPAGKIAVIEVASARFYAHPGVIPEVSVSFFSPTDPDAPYGRHYLTMTPLGMGGNQYGQLAHWMGTQTVRLYAGPGDKVNASLYININRGGDDPTSVVSGDVSITGYLVDAP